MKRQGRLFKTDSKIILGAIIGILVCLYFLFFDDGSGLGEDTSRPEVGVVTYRENDVRQKQKAAYVWDKLKEEQKIRLGDSVYSGQNSQIEVTLNSGGSVNVGENSLVTFEIIQNEKVMDIGKGNFRFKVNGTMKIAIQGEMTTFEGSNSEVQLFIGKNQKPQLKLMKGKAVITRKDKSYQLDSRTVASLPAPADDNDNPSDFPIPRARSTATFKYRWKLYDIYQPDGLEIVEKKYRPSFVKMDHQISWTMNRKRPSFIQWASNPEFKNSVSSETTDLQLDLDNVFIGENYWKVSADKKNWSKPQVFTVEGEFLPDAEPEIISPPKEITLFKQEVTISVPLKTKIQAAGFVAQASINENFTADATKTFWSGQPNIRLSFFKPGVYHYRFRSVNQNQEISRWSKPVAFTVVAPEKTLVPKLTRLPKEEPVQIVEKPKKKMAKVEKPKPVDESRKTAAVESSNTLKLDVPPRNGMPNDKYKNSQLAFQGFMWTMQSTDLVAQSKGIPVASGLGIHGYYWHGNHGFEGNFKNGVIEMNSVGKEIVAVRSMEARYHYRLFTGFPFNWTRELQTSLFAGYETYRNSGDLVAREYDLMKFGTSLEFPWSRKWSSGGEFVYGSGSDGSTKYEVSGNLNYFVNPSWSLGVGYRLHLFEAGSIQSSPTQLLPYREGYTEGFSNLIHYF